MLVHHGKLSESWSSVQSWNGHLISFPAHLSCPDSLILASHLLCLLSSKNEPFPGTNERENQSKLYLNLTVLKFFYFPLHFISLLFFNILFNCTLQDILHPVIRIKKTIVAEITFLLKIIRKKRHVQNN